MTLSDANNIVEFATSYGMAITGAPDGPAAQQLAGKMGGSALVVETVARDRNANGSGAAEAERAQCLRRRHYLESIGSSDADGTFDVA